MASCTAWAPAPRWRGNAEGLRRHHERVTIVAVEPAESPVLSGGPPGAHKIDGIGAGFVVPLWRQGIADQIEQVSTEDAIAMALRLAREEGLFAGSSTGANVIAALRLAEQLGPDRDGGHRDVRYRHEVPEDLWSEADRLALTRG